MNIQKPVNSGIEWMDDTREISTLNHYFMTNEGLHSLQYAPGSRQLLI